MLRISVTIVLLLALAACHVGFGVGYTGIAAHNLTLH